MLLKVRIRFVLPVDADLEATSQPNRGDDSEEDEEWSGTSDAGGTGAEAAPCRASLLPAI